jgi:hypothetical protein
MKVGPKKAANYKARERNADLRDAYFHFMSDFCSYHLVYVDESGCDKMKGRIRLPHQMEELALRLTLFCPRKHHHIPR